MVPNAKQSIAVWVILLRISTQYINVLLNLTNITHETYLRQFRHCFCQDKWISREEICISLFVKDDAFVDEAGGRCHRT
jgi:hypothetical protein